jgi:hypothetical protein
MGLIEYDWIVTQSKIKKNDYLYEDFVSKAEELSEYFKKEKCDVIIALTHMRSHNDV